MKTDNGTGKIADPPESESVGLLSNHGVEKMVALSPLQQGYLVGSRPDFHLHVHPHLYLEFDFPEFDITMFKQALNSLFRRHSILSATARIDGQLALSETPVDCNVVERNYLGLSILAQTKLLDKLRRRLSRKTFSSDDAVAGVYARVSNFGQFSRVHLSLDLLLLDGISVRLLLSDLSQLYETGRSMIDVCAFDTVKISTMQQLKKNSSRYVRAKQYWVDRLASLPDAPILPLNQTSQNQCERSHMLRRKHLLSKQQWAKASLRCEQLGVPASTVLLTLYGIVVSYWCKYLHFYMTMMLQGRERDQLEMPNLAANFAKIVLLEMDFREPYTLKEQITKVNTQVFRDITKSIVCGLEVMQEQNRANRSTARAASPVAFVSMLTDGEESIEDRCFQLESSRLRYASLETPQVLLDHQAISRTDGGVALIFDSVDSEFEEGTVEQIFTAYCNLVESFCDSSDVEFERVMETRCFDFRPGEQVSIDLEYNISEQALPKYLLHEHLAIAANKHPEKPLLIDVDGEHSYQDIFSLSNRLAHKLRHQLGVARGEVVAVCLPKGRQQIVAVQAILSAGGSYVPLMQQWPQNRKDHVLERCRCRYLINLDGDISSYSDNTLTALKVDSESLLEFPESALNSVQSFEDTAYILFTSGSTGAPKGVELDHLGPANTIDDINRRFSVRSDDRILGLSDLSFDLSVYDIFGTIAVGATLVLPQEGDQQDPAAIFNLVQQHQVTVWNSVPALAQLMVDYLALTKQEVRLPMRLMMFSGDWIPLGLPKALSEYCDADLYSLGGATEASIWSIYYPIKESHTSWKSIPYGFPLANQSMHVLDANLQARPSNVPGEIYIGGIGLAKSYWRDQAKTDAAFISHPVTGQRLYRTGDWGVRRAKGCIEFLGREDGQVKIRGFRIELGEIETVLNRHAEVKAAVVTAVGDKSESRQLCAFVVLNELDSSNDAAVYQEQLRVWLAQTVPSYMVPNRFIFLAQMPINATGKIDRKQLNKLSQDVAVVKERTVQSPTTELEQHLATLWCSILRCDVVSRDDDFFQLGGTSFDAVRLMVAIKDELQVDLPLAALIQTPTLSEFSLLVGESPYGDKKALMSVTKLSPSNAEQNLFWFPPSGGNVVCYRGLAIHMTHQLSSMGVTLPEPEPELNQSVEVLAEYAVQALKEQQPEGPYHLAGWSFGGILAYEIASQLIRQGDNVASLTLIDSPVIDAARKPSDVQLAAWFVSDLCNIGESQQFSNVANDLDSIVVDDILRAMIKRAEEQQLIENANELPIRHLFDVFKRNVTALDSYLPLPLADGAEMTSCNVFMATHSLEDRVDKGSKARWKELLPNHAAIVELAGNHYSMLLGDNAAVISDTILKTISTQVSERATYSLLDSTGASNLNNTQLKEAVK
jgi:pyochelin synthetase